MKPFRDAMFGMECRRSALVPRGQRRRVEAGENGNERTVVYLHPLDAIEEECRDEPSIWLEEALGWIVERAHAELDSVNARARIAVASGNAMQAQRMAKFCRENDAWELMPVITAERISGEAITVGKLVAGSIVERGRHAE